jgi:hypothetical protein
MNLQELRAQKQAEYDRLKPVEERLYGVVDQRKALLTVAQAEWYEALKPIQALESEIKALNRLIEITQEVTK